MEHEDCDINDVKDETTVTIETQSTEEGASKTNPIDEWIGLIYGGLSVLGSCIGAFIGVLVGADILQIVLYAIIGGGVGVGLAMTIIGIMMLKKSKK